MVFRKVLAQVYSEYCDISWWWLDKMKGSVMTEETKVVTVQELAQARKKYEEAQAHYEKVDKEFYEGSNRRNAYQKSC
jgi:hypothetical protein